MNVNINLFSLYVWFLFLICWQCFPEAVCLQQYPECLGAAVTGTKLHPSAQAVPGQAHQCGSAQRSGGGPGEQRGGGRRDVLVPAGGLCAESQT